MTQTSITKLAFTQVTVDRRQKLQNYSIRPHPAKDDAVNYLKRTLTNFAEHGGFRQSTVPWTLDISDSGSPLEFYEQQALPVFSALTDDVSRIQWHTGWSRNANQNFLHAMNVGANRGADWVIFIEDDIDVIADFPQAVVDWLTDHQTDDCHVYVFGAACLPNNKDKDKKDGPGWVVSKEAGEWTYPENGFMGTQCIGLRTADVLDLVTWLDQDKQFKARGYGYDCELRRWAMLRFGDQTPFKCTSPSFVQHCGDESAIHLGRFHTYDSFPGPEWHYNKRTRL